MNIKITIVLVTYGERADYVKTVCAHLRSDLIQSIVIVANWISAEQYKIIEAIDDQRICIVRHQKNEWSAWGYDAWLRMAETLHKWYILLLDDDNVIENDVESVLSYWSKLACEENKDALLLNRPIRSKRYLSEISSKRTTVTKNSFWAFHFKNIPFYAKEFFFGKKMKIKQTFWTVTSAYYGWLFFHGDLLKKIGYPRKDYFLYCDDTEFSHRIIQSWGSIYFLKDILISDLEESRNTSGNHIKSLVCWDQKKSYLSLRNASNFEKSIKTNQYSYFINKLCFMILLHIWFLLYWTKNRKNLFKAISDGQKMKTTTLQ